VGGVPLPSAPPTLVLHALRLKGFADSDVVAAHARLSQKDVAEILSELSSSGLAVRREGRITGWSLTPLGRKQHGELMGQEVDAAGCRDMAYDVYRQFLAINGDMLTVCTAWQMKSLEGEPVVNDHADPVYDKDVIARLRGIDDRVQPLCFRLAQVLDRFGGYGLRLRAALEKVEAGDGEWFTKPVIDSYHTVWFELHEDLLCSLGIERSKEEAPR
jgi:hypothetical protein